MEIRYRSRHYAYGRPISWCYLDGTLHWYGYSVQKQSPDRKNRAVAHKITGYGYSFPMSCLTPCGTTCRVNWSANWASTTLLFVRTTQRIKNSASPRAGISYALDSSNALHCSYLMPRKMTHRVTTFLSKRDCITSVNGTNYLVLKVLNIRWINV